MPVGVTCVSGDVRGRVSVLDGAERGSRVPSKWTSVPYEQHGLPPRAATAAHHVTS